MSKKVVPEPDMQQPIAQQASTSMRVDEGLQLPGKFEIKPDEEFEVTIHVKVRDGRWIICEPAEADENHWVKFRMWTYEEEIDLRKKATQYDPMKHWHFLDHDLLNRFKIQRLMKSWSFEKDNQRLKLLHVNGVMVDESFNAVMKLHPNILRRIVERMNEILELNN